MRHKESFFVVGSLEVGSQGSVRARKLNLGMSHENLLVSANTYRRN